MGREQPPQRKGVWGWVRKRPIVLIGAAAAGFIGIGFRAVVEDLVVTPVGDLLRAAFGPLLPWGVQMIMENIVALSIGAVLVAICCWIAFRKGQASRPQLPSQPSPLSAENIANIDALIGNIRRPTRAYMAASARSQQLVRNKLPVPDELSLKILELKQDIKELAQPINGANAALAALGIPVHEKLTSLMFAQYAEYLSAVVELLRYNRLEEAKREAARQLKHKIFQEAEKPPASEAPM